MAIQATAEQMFDLKPSRVMLQGENQRLRLAIVSAIIGLDRVNDVDGQDVEYLIAEVRDGLARTIGEVEGEREGLLRRR